MSVNVFMGYSRGYDVFCILEVISLGREFGGVSSGRGVFFFVVLIGRVRRLYRGFGGSLGFEVVV